MSICRARLRNTSNALTFLMSEIDECHKCSALYLFNYLFTENQLLCTKFVRAFSYEQFLYLEVIYSVCKIRLVRVFFASFS